MQAVFFSRTYCPSTIATLMPSWREDAAKHSKRAADALADPISAPEKFIDFDVGLKAEAIFKHRRDSAPVPPAAVYPDAKADLDVDVIAAVKNMLAAAALNPAPSPKETPQPLAPMSPSTAPPPTATVVSAIPASPAAELPSHPAAPQSSESTDARRALAAPAASQSAAHSTLLQQSVSADDTDNFVDADGGSDLEASEVLPAVANVSSAPAVSPLKAPTTSAAPLAQVPQPAAAPAPADPLDDFDIDDSDWQ
jgi:hypothetical protein